MFIKDLEYPPPSQIREFSNERGPRPQELCS